MGKTIAEKILGAHSGTDCSAGDIVLCELDAIMMHDANGPLCVRAFQNMGGVKVSEPSKVVVVFDHCTPAPTEKIANIHSFLRQFVKEQNVELYESGCGVCHQLMVESQRVKPGALIVGTDSHTCTYGALGTFSTGMGATDIAAALYTGQSWFKVPETIKIHLRGTLPPGCEAKDIILTVIGRLGADGANYCSVEFYGEWLENASEAERLTIANMLVEMGAKCGFTCCGSLGIWADSDARYCREETIDLSTVEPALAKPHTVDNFAAVKECEGLKIDQAVIGSCTNGRFEDLLKVSRILKGKKVADGCRLLILPASLAVYKRAVEEGVVMDLLNSGATIFPPGCGVCVGTHGGVPGDGEVVISSTNRNFRGRMGNPKADIYLASPSTVAVSALTGKITDPRKYLENEGGETW